MANKREQMLFNKYTTQPFQIFFEKLEYRIKYNLDTVIVVSCPDPVRGNTTYPPGYQGKVKVAATRILVEGLEACVQTISTKTESAYYPIYLEFDIQGMICGPGNPPDNFKCFFDNRAGIERLIIEEDRFGFISVLPGQGILPEALQGKFRFQIKRMQEDMLTLHIGYSQFLQDFSHEPVEEQLELFREALGAHFGPDF